MTNEEIVPDERISRDLAEWAGQLEREIAEATVGMRSLQMKIDAAKEKLDLVNRLVRLAKPTSTGNDQDNNDIQPESAPVALEDQIERILADKGAPMHVREIRATLIERGVPLPGRGDEANIILRLRRDEMRFMRTERGTYALSTWGLRSYSPASAKRTVRRTRKQAT